MRGSLIHGALFYLYGNFVNQAAIREVGAEQLDAHLQDAVRKAFGRYHAGADDVLQALLELEKQRVEAVQKQEREIATITAREKAEAAKVEQEQKLVSERART